MPVIFFFYNLYILKKHCFFLFSEIPLFHVLNARITFGNVNKCRTEEEAAVTPSEENEVARGSDASQSICCLKNKLYVS